MIVFESATSYELFIELEKIVEGGARKIAFILADLLEHGHSFVQDDYSTPWPDEFEAYTTNLAPRYKVMVDGGVYKIERL